MMEGGLEQQKQSVGWREDNQKKKGKSLKNRDQVTNKQLPCSHRKNGQRWCFFRRNGVGKGGSDSWNGVGEEVTELTYGAFV